MELAIFPFNIFGMLQSLSCQVRLQAARGHPLATGTAHLHGVRVAQRWSSPETLLGNASIDSRCGDPLPYKRRHGQGSPQRLLNEAPPRSIPGLDRLAPRARRAGGWCQWPMDGHGQPAGALDKGVIARAASCQQHACLHHDDAQRHWSRACSQGRV